MRLNKKPLIFTSQSRKMRLRGENMIKTTDMLLEELRSYGNPKAKLSRMVKQGECFQIVRKFSQQPFTVKLLSPQKTDDHLLSEF